MQDNNNLPIIIVTNMTSIYLQEIKEQLEMYNISNENEFCEAFMDIVNLYTETTFANQTEKMRAFLYFHDIEMLMNTIYNRVGIQPISLFSMVYENLILLFQSYYTYNNYLNDHPN